VSPGSEPPGRSCLRRPDGQTIAIAPTEFETRAATDRFGPQGTDAKSVEEFLVKSDIAFGSVEDVTQRSHRDAALVRSTGYLFSFPFAPIGSSDYLEGLKVLATNVYPQLRRDEDAFSPRSK
jgi:hypothetical protein